MAHAGEVLSQETLLEHVWDEYADPFTNTVRVTVGTLRRKLAVDDEPQLIETVIGRGYKLKDEPVSGRSVRPMRRTSIPIRSQPVTRRPRAMSIRLRLALTYSGVLCVLAAAVILAIYLALAHAVADSAAATAGDLHPARSGRSGDPGGRSTASPTR